MIRVMSRQEHALLELQSARCWAETLPPHKRQAEESILWAVEGVLRSPELWPQPGCYPSFTEARDIVNNDWVRQRAYAAMQPYAIALMARQMFNWQGPIGY